MSGTRELPEAVTTLPRALAFWAERTPDAPALIAANGLSTSYCKFWRQARGIGEALQDRGVRRDACVLVLLPEGPALATALLGAASAAVAFPLAESISVSELEALWPRVSVGAAIVAADFGAQVRGYLEEYGIPVLMMNADESRPVIASIEGSGGESGRSGPLPTDVAFLGQTSGTTGRSKLVPRTHGNVVDGGRRHGELFALTPEDRALAVAPMTFVLGRTVLLHTVAAGASLIFPATTHPADVRAAIEKERPTWMHAAAGFLELLAEHARSHPEVSGSSLRFVRVTAAPIAPEVCGELEHWLGAPVLPSYSSSETGFIATTLPRAGWRKAGSAGRPVQEIRIVGEDQRDVAAGEPGEIWVRGEKVFDGYQDDAEVNLASFTADGWFRTGDVGYCDDEGFLFLTGRLKELVNRGGAKISPIEVDRVLLAHPAVRDAATFAIPDERLGEDIAAAVVPMPGQSVTARALRSWMLDRLPIYAVPRRIWFLIDAELPRTGSGKVQRGELARRWRAHIP